MDILMEKTSQIIDTENILLPPVIQKLQLLKIGLITQKHIG